MIEVAGLAAAIAAGLVARGLVYGRRAFGFKERPHRTANRHDLVGIAVTRPIIPVPSLTDAYSALPSHCWDVLGR